MPGKSGRGKRKQPSLSKKKKSKRMVMAVAAQQPPASQPEVRKSPERVSTPVSSIAPVRYPYIHAELRRIVILSGVILGILVVLAFVLS